MSIKASVLWNLTLFIAFHSPSFNHFPFSLFSSLHTLVSVTVAAHRKSLDAASTKFGAAMRMAMVQMMLNTLNPMKHRRSMTAEANCHCSAMLSILSCSRMCSTMKRTSSRRACSCPSTESAWTTQLWPCIPSTLPSPPPPTSRQPPGPVAPEEDSKGGDTGGGCEEPSNPRGTGWWWWWWRGCGVSPFDAPPPPPPAAALPRLMVLFPSSGSGSVGPGKVWKPM